MFMPGRIKSLEAKIFNQVSFNNKLNILPQTSYITLTLFEQKLLGISKTFSPIESDSTKSMIAIINYPTIRKEKQKTEESEKEEACSPLINRNEVLLKSPETQQEPLKKYTFKPNNSSYIKIPPTFSTDNEYQKQVIDYFNEGYADWFKVDSDKRIEIYQKNNVKPPIVKSYFTVDFDRPTIVQAMSNFEERKKWDKGFSNATLVDQMETKDIQTQTIYFYMKSKIPFVEDRDMIRLKTTWNNCPNDKTTLIHVVSVDHPKYPIQKKIYRARVIITGYFIEEIQPNKCSVGIINQLELGMSDFLTKQVLPKTVYGWYDNVQTGCKYVLSHR